MAISKLPDEMLLEVLGPTMNVPDEKFTCTEKESPFASVSQSSSIILLVCKRWLRVGNPLLYRTVILRSLAQAQALADTLQSNKSLGRHVKQLRVEGGFGVTMHRILTLTPNVTDLYLSLLIWSSDSVSGLCRSLSVINPSRVILQDIRYDFKFNAKTRELVLTLCKCIQSWSNLVTFDFPYVEPMSPSMTDRSNSIAMALRDAPNLETVVMTPTYWVPPHLLTIGGNQSLKKIQIKPFSDATREILTQRLAFPAYERLRAIVTFEQSVCPSETPQIKQPTAPAKFTTPMEHASDDIKDMIWSEILAFALSSDVLSMPLNGFGNYGHIINIVTANYRIGLLLVSKTFHKLTLPYLYRHPVFYSREGLRRFSERLDCEPSLGLHLRSLFISRQKPLFSGYQDCLLDREETDGYLQSIVTHTPKLTRLYGSNCHGSAQWPFDLLRESSVSWETFCLTANTAGSSLIELESVSIYGSPAFVTSFPLHSLKVLRSLEWDCPAKIDENEAKTFKECLPCLEYLRVTSFDPSFFTLLSYMRLPALSRFSYAHLDNTPLREFLAKHGGKLCELELKNMGDHFILDSCPIVNVLSFPPNFMDPYLAGLHPNNAHNHLRKICCLTESHVTSALPLLGYQGIDGYYQKFFTNLDFTLFPALREICVSACFWPADERKASKNPWVAHSELLLEASVRLTDRNGTSWRHRLKRSKRR